MTVGPFDGPGNFDGLHRSVVAARIYCNANTFCPDNCAINPIPDLFRRGTLFLKFAKDCLLNSSFDFWGRHPRDRSGPILPSPQCGADVEAIANTVLGRKARAHGVALVVEQLASAQGAAF